MSCSPNSKSAGRCVTANVIARPKPTSENSPIRRQSLGDNVTAPTTSTSATSNKIIP